MPKHYTPTAEQLAALGYGPDERHTIWQLKAYSRKVPAPVLPYVATLVVQVNELNGLVYLTRHAKTVDELWPCHPLPSQAFFEQLLQALGWPVGPPLPVIPEASAELMLLRWIAYHPAEAYRLQLHIDEQSSCLTWLGEADLIQVTMPERPEPGAGPPKIRPPRPGLIEPTARGLDYLHQRRNHRETPENLPPVVKALPANLTKTTK